jgi:hypothetical protein
MQPMAHKCFCIGLGALLVLAVACGGRAEQDTSTTEGGAAGSGGTLIGVGGTLGGAGGSAGTLALGGTSAGGAVGRQPRRMNCDHGTLNYVVAPSKVIPTGFSGKFDDTPLELAPGNHLHYPPVSGTITGEAFSCLSGTSFTIRLGFGAPHEGEHLYFEVGMGNVCEITAGYWLDASQMEPIPVDIDVTFEAWDPPNDVPVMTFMQGEFTANVAEPLGHTVSGTFSVASDHPICLL